MHLARVILHHAHLTCHLLNLSIISTNKELVMMSDFNLPTISWSDVVPEHNFCLWPHVSRYFSNSWTLSMGANYFCLLWKYPRPNFDKTQIVYSKSLFNIPFPRCGYTVIKPSYYIYSMGNSHMKRLFYFLTGPREILARLEGLSDTMIGNMNYYTSVLMMVLLYRPII